MKIKTIADELSSEKYHGRGIIAGKTADGKYAAAAYFIMGRSENSRNRIFIEDGDGIRTQAFDPAKLKDPGLIIYSPVRILNGKTIITNGDQTDTIYDGMQKGLSFSQSLEFRTFEPDAPNYTPRISALISVEGGSCNFRFSILKSAEGNPTHCERFSFFYETLQNGEGRFIHTYMRDGNPLPSFEGEPKKVEICSNIEDFTNTIWQNLNEDNKISLFTRFIEIKSGKFESRIVNKN